MAQKANSLAHTKWMCKYHIVFCPKYRRKAIYNQYREDLGQILRRVELYGLPEGEELAPHVRQARKPQV